MTESRLFSALAAYWSYLLEPEAIRLPDILSLILAYVFVDFLRKGGVLLRIWKYFLI